jgi:hypothetical protein
MIFERIDERMEVRQRSGHATRKEMGVVGCQVSR